MITAKPINFLNINAFSIANNWNVHKNESNTLYFMLYDTSLKTRQVFSSASITVKFLSQEHGEFVSKTAIPVSTLDASLFKINLLPVDAIASGNVYFEAVLDGVSKKWILQNGIAVFDNDSGSSVC